MPRLLTDALIADLVRLLLALRYTSPDRIELLLHALPPPIRGDVPHHAEPRLHLTAALQTLDAPERRPHLRALIDAARHHASPELPAHGELRALLARLDHDAAPAERACALGLIGNHHGVESTSTALTVCLDRVGAAITLRYICQRQTLGPYHFSTDALAALDVGDASLYDLLFPGAGRDARGARLDPFAALDRGPTATEAVRLRICTRDPALAALDWHTLADPDQRPTRLDPLPWTVEITSTPAPTHHLRLVGTPRVIVLSPDAERATALRDVLHIRTGDRRFDPRVIAAPTTDGLRDALGTLKRPLVLTADVDAATLDALADILAACDADHRPAAVCLCAPPASPLTRLSPHTAALVRAPDIARAHDWLLAVVADGLDPVTAAHPADAPPLPVHAQFAQWSAERAAHEERPLPGLVLDRIHQRRAVKGQLETLVKHNSAHRVEVFVAVAPPANALHELDEQIDDHLCREALENPNQPVIDLDRHLARLPRTPPAVATRPVDEETRKAWLWDALRAATRRDPRLGVDQLLDSVAADSVPGVDRVVWLYWGTFGRAHPLPSPAELALWLDWHQDLAGKIGPRRDLRIASLIACQHESADIRDKVVAQVRQMSLDRNINTVRYTPLPPVGEVPPEELRAYLDDYAVSRVPPELVRDLARALYRQTQGRYTELVALLDRGARIGHGALLRELSAPPAAPDHW